MTPDSKKRPYHSPDRLERARATARDILAAAESLFRDEGYAAVTMKAIARAAGVSPATVYLHFASKAAIVEALARAITDDPELSVERVEGEPAVAGQLRVGAAILRKLNERSWLIAEILRARAVKDSDLEAVRAEWLRRHLDAVTRGVEAVAGAGRLRPDLATGEAIDILYAIGGTDLYRVLTRERSWSGAQYEAWLAKFVEDFLLARS